MSVVITVGNHSFIPLNVTGNPVDHVREILGALSAFEKAHPDLEITTWQVEKQQNTYSISSYIFGLWVDHRPKKE